MPQLTCPFCQSSLVLPLSALVGANSEDAVPQLLHPSLTEKLRRVQRLRRAASSTPQLAPPAPRPALLCLTLGPVLFSLGVYLVALGTNLAPLCLALGTFITLTGISMFRFNRSELPALHTRWAESSRCQSCFGVFTRDHHPATEQTASSSLGAAVTAFR